MHIQTLVQSINGTYVKETDLSKQPIPMNEFPYDAGRNHWANVSVFIYLFLFNLQRSYNKKKQLQAKAKKNKQTNV